MNSFIFLFLFLLLHFFRHYLGPALFYHLFYSRFQKSLAPIKVQAGYPDEKQLAMEKANIRRSEWVDLGVLFFCSLLYVLDVTKLDLSGVNQSYLMAIGAFFGLVFLQDFYFYVTHRLMHIPWMYRKVHVVHHRSVKTNPYTSFSMHPMEKVIELFFYPLIILLLPLTGTTLLVFVLISTLVNFIGHSGFEFNKLSKIPPNPLATTPTFHEGHHIHPNTNFSLYLILWDHLLGTAYQPRQEQA